MNWGQLAQQVRLVLGLLELLAQQDLRELRGPLVLEQQVLQVQRAPQGQQGVQVRLVLLEPQAVQELREAL